MAEHLSETKSPIECVLECPLCLHQLKLPQTLQQCLHSYCRSCLDKVPQKTQDGRPGWLCPLCESFTKSDQVQQNTFLEKLQKIHAEPQHCDTIKCEQCSDECGSATWRCAECKIGMCDSAKIAHLRIPMLKSHNVILLDTEEENFIDDIVFCKVHEGIPTQLNCCVCDQLICYKCTTIDHQEHRTETVEQALERILPEAKSSARQIDENIRIIEAQIEAVKKEIEQIKESYASCRMQMDVHLEKVICRMRAMKAKMEEDVNEQESIALDTLKDHKQQLAKQLSQARIISSLTAVVTTKTKHTSQLKELQTGLFDKVKAIGAKKEDLHFQLPEAKFIEGHRLKEELENIFGELRFDLKGNNISTSGEVCRGIDDNFLCNDLEDIVDCYFVKSLEIDTGSKWCNRISHIDDKFWLPLEGESQIKLYNKDGKHEQTIDTGGKNIIVVRKAYNGDLICGGSNGLYKTTKDFTEWVMLAEGQFSDVVVHQRSFFVLEFGSEFIDKYSLTEDGEWHSISKQKLVADKPKDFKLSTNSTFLFSGDHFWVSSNINRQLYKFSDTGKYLQMWEEGKVGGADLSICGADQKGKALLADYINGHFYLLDAKQKDEIVIKEIWKAVKLKEIRDAVFDHNNDIWTISGTRSQGIKLTKFTQKRKI